MLAGKMSKRRRFQAPLTNFFSRTSNHSLDCDDRELSQHKSQPDAISSPDPASVASPVQSSLLTVGMRIRKSVPEGYKTHSASTQTSSASKCLYEPSFFVGSERAQVQDEQPYCSADLIASMDLHMVGGLAVQAFPSMAETPVLGLTLAGESAFISSQQSALSSSMNPSTALYPKTRKRCHAFDLDSDDGHPGGSPSDVESASVVANYSSMTYPYSYTCMPDLTRFSSPNVTMRTIAQPRSKRRKEVGVVAKGSADIGCEQIQSAFGVPRDFHFDFGEAAFLKPREDVEMDGC